MGEFAELEQRIDRLSAGSRPDRDSLLEMEATLSDGYAHALAAEARLKQLDRRLEWLIEALDVADARQIRSVGYERRQLAHRVARLRVRLQDMHDRFAALLEADRRLEQ